MEKNDARKAGYRLAARLSGSRLTIERAVCERLEQDFADRIDAIRRRRMHPDRKALEESVEWERLGDFRLATGTRLAAVRAYGKAAFCCCKGRDCDCGMRPLRSLRQRFFRLKEKAVAACSDDARLSALLPDPEG